MIGLCVAFQKNFSISFPSPYLPLYLALPSPSPFNLPIPVSPYSFVTLYSIIPSLEDPLLPDDPLLAIYTLNKTHIAKAHKLISTYKRKHAMLDLLDLGYLTQDDCF